MRALPLFALLLIATPSLSMGADRDGDGVPDDFDNCLAVANASQVNSDHDRFGNACDGDVDQNGTTDAVDRKLLAAEVGARRPRPIADLDGDGRVVVADLALFDASLRGRPPGPAGARAHDSDGDGLLDFCARDGEPETPREDLANGGLDGAPPPGWSTPNPSYLAFVPDQGRSRAGAIQWLTWGGAGRGYGHRCRSSCIEPDPLPVEPGRGYAFSFFTCVAEFPPTSLSLGFGEYDAEGGFLRMRNALNTSKILNSAPGIWEENVFYYQPSGPDVARVQPKLFRKGGPAGARGTIWADDFSFRALEKDRRRAGRMPPSSKQPFVGARTRVDELGNLRILRDGAWRDVIPFGIYVHSQQDYRVYVDAGFDVVMNERGFGAEAAPGIDAISPLVPDGMSFMLRANRWHAPQPAALALETALSNLRTKTSPVRGIRLWDRLLAFYYDNEIFSRCGARDEASGECLARMWEAERAPLARLFEVDREENGGVRGVPSYFLNGNVGVARAYSGQASAVDAEGSVRADTTGTYGAAGIHDLEHAHNQLAPTLIVQVQGHVGDRFRAIALGGLAVGAKMIGVWRDWPPSSPTHGRVRVAPELQLCGAVDFGLRTRRRYQNPSGQIVTGAESGARAEILDGPKPYDECPGNGGATYRVHVRRGRFGPGEALRDAESGAPIAGATVAGTRGEGLVDYEVTIARRRWYEEMPKLRREVDALAPILRASHWTDWQARVRATARGLGPVPFGDEGIVWGTRTHDGEAYLFLANTFHQLDPHRDWDAQWLGRPLDVEVRLESLPGRALRARRFDVEALSFTDTGSVPIEGGRFVLTLPTFGVEVLHLVRERE